MYFFTNVDIRIPVHTSINSTDPEVNDHVNLHPEVNDHVSLQWL